MEIWRSLGYSNSERTQQEGADERKHGTHRQHIEPQGKVHVAFSLVVDVNESLTEVSIRPK